MGCVVPEGVFRLHSCPWSPVADDKQIQAAQFTATGSLSFLSSWKPVLSNPDLQVAQESPTGYKESYDLGYTLRTRYPDLYIPGTQFYAW